MDPVQVELIATAAMAAGGIIFCGALYAIFYALGRLSNNMRLIQIGFLSYIGLLAATVLLARALQLHGVWLGLIPCLLLGYLLAPPLIWRLCAGVHVLEQSQELGESHHA
jgi:hypothetical protein